MGEFWYEDLVLREFDDWALHHLKTVITTKLSRGEAFNFAMDQGSSQSEITVWMHPQCAIVYTFSQTPPKTWNMAWLRVLMAAANSRSGLYLAPEPTSDVGLSGASHAVHRFDSLL